MNHFRLAITVALGIWLGVSAFTWMTPVSVTTGAYVPLPIVSTLEPSRLVAWPMEIRAKMSDTSEVVCVAWVGNKLTVLGWQIDRKINDGWYLVQLGTCRGYVRGLREY